MIILEGPDCAGKTTLANKLIKEDGKYQGANYVHYSKHNSKQFCTDLIEASKARYPTVFDRMHLSHIPYDFIYRGLCPSADTVKFVDEVAQICGATIIICLPPWPLVLEQFHKRKDIELVQEEMQLLSIYHWYKAFAHRYTECPVRYYDYTVNDYRKLI